MTKHKQPLDREGKSSSSHITAKQAQNKEFSQIPEEQSQIPREKNPEKRIFEKGRSIRRRQEDRC